MLIAQNCYGQQNVQIFKYDGVKFVDQKIEEFKQGLNFDSCYYGSVYLCGQDTIVKVKASEFAVKNKLDRFRSNIDLLRGSYVFFTDEIRRLPTGNNNTGFLLVAHFFVIESKTIVFYDDFFSIDKNKDKIETDLDNTELNLILELLEITSK